MGFRLRLGIATPGANGNLSRGGGFVVGFWCEVLMNFWWMVFDAFLLRIVGSFSFHHVVQQPEEGIAENPETSRTLIKNNFEILIIIIN